MEKREKLLKIGHKNLEYSGIITIGTTTLKLLKAIAGTEMTAWQ